LLPTATLTVCRRVNGPPLPLHHLRARTIRATIGIVQTVTGEGRGTENGTNGIDVTEMSIGLLDLTDGTGNMIPREVLGGLLLRRLGPREGQEIRSPSHPLRGEDGHVHALGRSQGERMETRIRTRMIIRQNRTLGARGCWPLLRRQSRMAKGRTSC
jgi:hypothetical protein